MPGLSGLELLRRVRREHPGTDFVLVTAHASVPERGRGAAHGRERLPREAGPAGRSSRSCSSGRSAARRLRRRRTRGCATRSRTVESCRVLASLPRARATSTRWRSTCAPRGRRGARRRALPAQLGAALRRPRAARLPRRRGAAACAARSCTRSRSTCARVEPHRACSTTSPLHAASGAPGVDAEVLLAVPDARRGGGGRARRGARSAAQADPGAPRARGRGRRARRARAAQRRALRAGEGARLRRRRHRGLQRALPARGDRPRDPPRRALRQPSSRVLFLDLDRFKLVNDRTATWSARTCCASSRGVLDECVRQVDTLARYGGDEFTILLRRHRARRARRRSPSASAASVEETPSRRGRGAPMRLTLQRRASRPSRSHGRDREDAARRGRQGDVPGQVAGPQPRLLGRRARPEAGVRAAPPRGADARLPLPSPLLTPTSRFRDVCPTSEARRWSRDPDRELDPLGRSAPHARAPARSREALVGPRGRRWPAGCTGRRDHGGVIFVDLRDRDGPRAGRVPARRLAASAHERAGDAALGVRDRGARPRRAAARPRR